MNSLTDLWPNFGLSTNGFHHFRTAHVYYFDSTSLHDFSLTQVFIVVFFLVPNPYFIIELLSSCPSAVPVLRLELQSLML